MDDIGFSVSLVEWMTDWSVHLERVQLIRGNMGEKVGEAGNATWESPSSETRELMRRELLGLRKWERFRLVDLDACVHLADLPVVLAAARRDHLELRRAIPKVIEDALIVLAWRDPNARALQAAYGITISGRSARERRAKYLETLRDDDRVNSVETLKSREKIGARTLLTYLIDESQSVVNNLTDPEPYWRERQRLRGQFRPLAVVSSSRLGPDGQLFESEWDGIYRIAKDGVTEFSNPYRLPGSDAEVEIVVVEGGTYQGVVSESSSEGEVRWSMRLHREMNTGDVVRLHWRGRVTLPPGGRPPQLFHGQSTEVVLPWLHQEVFFHPDRLPKFVGKALGPLSGWPQRCEYNEQVKLDPDLCARAFWTELQPEDTMGLYWEWD